MRPAGQPGRRAPRRRPGGQEVQERGQHSGDGTGQSGEQHLRDVPARPRTSTVASGAAGTPGLRRHSAGEGPDQHLDRHPVPARGSGERQPQPVERVCGRPGRGAAACPGPGARRLGEERLPHRAVRHHDVSRRRSGGFRSLGAGRLDPHAAPVVGAAERFGDVLGVDGGGRPQPGADLVRRGVQFPGQQAYPCAQGPGS